MDAYDKSWGRFKAITYPTPGNHEYYLYDAQGYYRYFGAAAHEARSGFYSFDLGAWHIVALNSNCFSVGGCDVDSAQIAWLQQDLRAHPAKCVLAYWHHPQFSSGRHGSDSTFEAFWDILGSAGVDVVLGGHDHLYERFAPQLADGAPDPKGIREFVVGTGGASFYQTTSRQPNSEVVGEHTFGVLFLTLAADGYTWSFESAAGTAFTDHDLGRDHLDAAHRLFRRHRIGQVDGNKCQIDLAQVIHFRNTLGVSSDVDREVAEGRQVAVVLAFRMELAPRLRTLYQVVSRNGAKLDAADCPFVPVSHHGDAFSPTERQWGFWPNAQNSTFQTLVGVSVTAVKAQNLFVSSVQLSQNPC